MKTRRVATCRDSEAVQKKLKTILHEFLYKELAVGYNKVRKQIESR